MAANSAQAEGMGGATPMSGRPDPGPAPFNLSRWFAIVALLSIAAISMAMVFLLSRFVTDRMLWQEGELTTEFVQSVVLAEKSLLAYFANPDSTDPDAAGLKEALGHIGNMPDVLRANVYDTSRHIIWSTDRGLVGRHFAANAELEEALSGMFVVRGSEHDTDLKAEHQDLVRRANFFVEIYVPVRDEGGERVIGAIELYKNPQGLFKALQSLRAYIALGAALAGGFLYLALFGLVRRADLLIREQQRLLVEGETLAVVGEMSSAVAHGIRNPLASIRSSAELVLETDPETGREAAADIIAESDRLEAWIRELLSYSRPLDQKPDAVRLGPLIERSVDEFGRELQRRGIAVAVDLPGDLPAVRGDPLLLGQVIHSLVANAIEAIQQNGRLELACEQALGRRRVQLSIRDNGPGMTAEQLARVGKPFYTTKAKGLGVGLALARRVIERFGGSIEIDSAPGKGTVVRVVMRAA
jgi:signal transduction histidine kinase